MKEQSKKDEWEDYRADRCYECTGYGDDYYIDEDGNLVKACDDCPYNKQFEERENRDDQTGSN